MEVNIVNLSIRASKDAPREVFATDIAWDEGVEEAFKRQVRKLARRKAAPAGALLEVYDTETEAHQLFGTLDANGRVVFSEPYVCNDCGFTASGDCFPPARDIEQRFCTGDTFTDSECPCCGALAHPVSDDDPALTMDEGQGGADYTLLKKHSHCWISVGKLSIKVARRRGGAVLVEAFRKGDEGSDPLDQVLVTA